MAGKNTLILASDFNALQSSAALVLGQGSGTYGYGQSVTSSQVSTGTRISISQWENLRNDLLKCIQHQTDTSYANNLTTPAANVTLASEIYDEYKLVSDAIGPGRFALPAGQATRATINSAQRVASWNTVVSHTVVVNFTESTIYPGTYNSRYFFNSGGKIEFTASRTGGNSGSKNTSWTTLLTNMGTITFDYDTTSTSGQGTGSGIGFYDLTTSDQTIFTRALTSAESYYPNKYYINARVNDTTNRNQITFTIYFADDSGQPNPPWGTDESVDGTLTSTVQTYRATGSNVSILQPTSPTSTL
jgi:hypothetical protein